MSAVKKNEYITRKQRIKIALANEIDARIDEIKEERKLMTYTFQDYATDLFRQDIAEKILK